MTASPWPERRLGDVATMGSGGTPSRAVPRFFGGGIPWVSISDMTTSGKYVTATATTLTNEGLNASAARLYERGVVLYAMYASLGEVCLTVGRVSSSQAILGIRAGKDLDAEYLYYYLEYIKPFVKKLGQQGTQANLNAGMVRDFRLPLPDRQEQRRIANALADADDLISTLERLVAKEQSIKQGMMQQLLTGRTRLPGFADEWSPVRLRDAGGTYGGLVDKSKDDFGTGSATFVTFMEVMAGARLLGRRLERVRVRPNERQNRVLRGDVLFNGSSETPEEVALAAVVDFEPTHTTYLNSFCFGYRLKTTDQIDPTYLAHFFRSGQGREIVSVLAQGATRYNIAKTKLMDVSPVLPGIDEQRAIVSVLSDVEAEIDALSARLAKARAVKTGMMQQLLTGRTRLPVEAAS